MVLVRLGETGYLDRILVGESIALCVPSAFFWGSCTVSRITAYFFALFAFFLASLAATNDAKALPSLVVDGPSGQLLGADNVNLGSLGFYDVRFFDGTCIGIFGGCDDAGDFAFNSEANARIAAQALLDQVLLDVPRGNFDSDPAATTGCVASCEIHTIFNLGGGVTVATALNTFPTGFDRVLPGTFTFARNFDFSRTDDGEARLGIYAKWSVSSDQPVQIPETSSVILLGTGLLGIARFRRLTSKGVSPF